MTTTTFEPHNLSCIKCANPIGPCEEFGCTNRYDHPGGLCPACEAEEEGRGGES